MYKNLFIILCFLLLFMTTLSAQEIHEAALNGDLEKVKILIEKKTNLNTKDSYGFTPLHLAAINGHENIIRVFIKNGADINIQSIIGKTALDYASDYGNEEIIEFLKSKGAVETQDKFLNIQDKYFNQKKPQLKPELFLPGIISSPNFEHGSPAYSQDMTEIYWCNRYNNNKNGDIFFMEFVNNKWRKPKIVSFSVKEFIDCNPVMSFDGNFLFFVSCRPQNNNESSTPYNIWFVERTNTGWLNAQILGTVNSEYSDGGPTLSNNGTLYFFSNRFAEENDYNIYYSKFVDGQYTKPENIGDEINSEHMEIYPYIAPDESYILFYSSRPKASGGEGLYISFKDKDGFWTKAFNINSILNLDESACFPSMSPDGKYFFFCSSKDGNYDIYWMKASFIDEIINN